MASSLQAIKTSMQSLAPVERHVPAINEDTVAQLQLMRAPMVDAVQNAFTGFAKLRLPPVPVMTGNTLSALTNLGKLDFGHVRWLADTLSVMGDEDAPGGWRRVDNHGARPHRRRMALALLRYGRRSGSLRSLIQANMDLPFRDAPAAICALLGGRTALRRLLKRLEAKGGQGTALWWWARFAVEFLDELATPVWRAQAVRLQPQVDQGDELIRFRQRHRAPRADERRRFLEPLVATISRHGPPARVTERCSREEQRTGLLVAA
jgi:hypothetical protein